MTAWLDGCANLPTNPPQQPAAQGLLSWFMVYWPKAYFWMGVLKQEAECPKCRAAHGTSRSGRPDQGTAQGSAEFDPATGELQEVTSAQQVMNECLGSVFGILMLPFKPPLVLSEARATRYCPFGLPLGACLNRLRLPSDFHAFRKSA